MKNLLISALLLLTSCGYSYKKVEKIITKEGVVTSVHYTPAINSSSVQPSIGHDGKIGIVPVHIHVPAKYIIIFSTGEDKAIVPGIKYFNMFDYGDKANLVYKETWLETYLEEKLVERKRVYYNFIEAVKLN